MILLDPVKKPIESKDLFAEDDIFDNKSSISDSKPDKPVKVKSLGLFDDDDDDDDNNDIFNTSSISQNKKAAPIFNNEPPELQPAKESKQPDVAKVYSAKCYKFRFNKKFRNRWVEFQF